MKAFIVCACRYNFINNSKLYVRTYMYHTTAINTVSMYASTHIHVCEFKCMGMYVYYNLRICMDATSMIICSYVYTLAVMQATYYVHI